MLVSSSKSEYVLSQCTSLCPHFYECMTRPVTVKSISVRKFNLILHKPQKIVKFIAWIILEGILLVYCCHCICLMAQCLCLLWEWKIPGLSPGDTGPAAGAVYWLRPAVSDSLPMEISSLPLHDMSHVTWRHPSVFCVTTPIIICVALGTSMMRHILEKCLICSGLSVFQFEKKNFWFHLNLMTWCSL